MFVYFFLVSNETAKIVNYCELRIIICELLVKIYK